VASGIKLTGEEMRYIALFENITGATARDCVIDEKGDRVIFVVKPGDIGLAIGKRGSRIKLLHKMVTRDVEVVEYADAPEVFIRNAFSPAKVRELRIIERSDGRKIAIANIDPRDKGVAIGKNGKNAEKTRLFAKRYFQIDDVVIT
jgi:N utilization substance protein A